MSRSSGVVHTPIDGIDRTRYRVSMLPIGGPHFHLIVPSFIAHCRYLDWRHPEPRAIEPTPGIGRNSASGI
ncbi:hypothetical protein NK897_24135, partial [Salmonella enterica subsp. enterica serovar Typhimurium]|nr:hypothetical protein [Salmonella enterica subsp. enterica serovar Typhimurium]